MFLVSVLTSEFLFCACVLSKNECRLTYYQVIAFLYFTSICYHFFGKNQHSPSSEKVYSILLFFIASTLEAATMLSFRNLFLCPFLPLSLKFLVYPFMSHPVPECTGLNYALEIQRNMVLCCKSSSNFL